VEGTCSDLWTVCHPGNMAERSKPYLMRSLPSVRDFPAQSFKKKAQNVLKPLNLAITCKYVPEFRITVWMR
jgi:hypothetical protein